MNNRTEILITHSNICNNFNSNILHCLVIELTTCLYCNWKAHSAYPRRMMSWMTCRNICRNIFVWKWKVCISFLKLLSIHFIVVWIVVQTADCESWWFCWCLNMSVWDKMIMLSLDVTFLSGNYAVVCCGFHSSTVDLSHEFSLWW